MKKKWCKQLICHEANYPELLWHDIFQQANKPYKFW